MPPTSAVNILALDGGGTRGIAELYCLKWVLSSRFATDVRRCDIFDLIVGTSTGGIVAVLLGRLRLTIPQAIESYLKLIPIIFSRESRTLTAKLKINAILGRAKYSKKNFQQAVKREIHRIVGGKDGTVGETMTLFDSEAGGCRTAVVATYKSDARSHRVFRSYVKPNSHEQEGCKIWEAIRATSAAPLFFSSMTVDGVDYWDGGLGANNPVMVAIEEAKAMITEGTFRSIGCVLSLGTGLQPAIPVDLKGNMLGFATTTLANMATATRESHRSAVRTANESKFLYARFDPENTSRIPLDAHLEHDLRELKGLASSWMDTEDNQDKATNVAAVLRLSRFPGKFVQYYPGMAIPEAAAVGVDFWGGPQYVSLNEVGGNGTGASNGNGLNGGANGRGGGLTGDYVVPGKFHPRFQSTYYVFNGSEYKGEHCKIIVDYTGTQWTRISDDMPHSLPPNAILFGTYSADAELYVARGLIQKRIAWPVVANAPTSDVEITPGRFSPQTGFHFTWHKRDYGERNAMFEVTDIDVLCYE